MIPNTKPRTTNAPGDDVKNDVKKSPLPRVITKSPQTVIWPVPKNSREI